MAMTDRDVTLSGETRIIYWLAGVLVVMVMAAGSFWLTYVAAQVDDLRLEQKVGDRESGMLRERLKGVETKLESVDATTRQTAEDVRQIRERLEGHQVVDRPGQP